MGCSVYVYMVYGVKTKLSDLVENAEVETRAECHPDRFSDEDKFCPECGNEVVQRTKQKQVKKPYQSLLPEYKYQGMGIEEWFDMGKFPEKSLDAVQLEGYNQEYSFIGKRIREVGDVMCGRSDRHVMKVDVEYTNPEMKEFLQKLGYDEDEIGLYVVPVILC